MELIGAVVAVAFFAPAFYLVVHHDIELMRQERQQLEDQALEA